MQAFAMQEAAAGQVKDFDLRCGTHGCLSLTVLPRRNLLN